MLRHYNLPLNYTTNKGVPMAKYTKKQATAIIVDCARKYKENLDGYQLLFILRDKHKQITSLEVSFNSYNFLHLTGIKLTHPISATDFYNRCLTHKLSPDDFTLCNDGTTQLKLEVLPQLVSKNLSAKMVGNFDGCNPKLYTEKLAGGVNACLGFIKTNFCNYVPNTVLNIDIRSASRTTLQILATYRKKKSDPVYIELVYKAKNVNWKKINFPEKYSSLPKPE